ncbi:hypothetical protein, partial [Tautonia sociabilis]|uniref:hypothetical protein n=1 Tax=Tautonia sociabilis TaxID=2080755 RepID=UPI0018F34649
RLPATNLLRFAPGATGPLTRFLDDVVRIRADEWEPRYNLDPVLFADVRIVNLGAPAASPPAGPAPAAAPRGAAAPPAEGDRPAPPSRRDP